MLVEADSGALSPESDAWDRPTDMFPCRKKQKRFARTLFRNQKWGRAKR
jgi:hypothetical protein